jgi:hypothetical protein
MGWFKSNTNKESSMTKKDEIAKATYKVVIKEKLGSTLRTVREFPAVRFIDEEDHVVYLQSEPNKFYEIFPEAMVDYNNFTEKEVDTRLDKTKKELIKQRDLPEPTINPKNLEFEILKLQGKKRSFKFSKNSSYITYDENGKPTFYYLRQGSTFIPMKWDSDTSTIYTPSDNKKKSAAIALRNKRNKYITQDKALQYSFFLIAVAIIAFAISGYMLLKTYDKVSESEIVDARLSCLTDTKAINAEVRATAKEVNGMAKALNDQLNRPQTVIGGVIPR